MMKNMTVIDQEAVEILLDLIKDAIRTGTEYIHIGDLEYIFPELVDRANEELQKEI